MNKDAQLLAEAREAMVRAVTVFEDPVELSSGQMSDYIVDAKLGVSYAPHLFAVGRALGRGITALLEQYGDIRPNVAGGMAQGANHVTPALSYAIGTKMMYISKAAEQVAGRETYFHGLTPDQDSRIILTDDATTTAGSFRQAWERIQPTGGQVVAGVAIVDRSDGATARYFKDRFDAPFYSLYNGDTLCDDYMKLTMGEN